MVKMLSGPELAEQWHEIKPLVDKALECGNGSVTSYGLFIQCLAATAQCWKLDGGVAITRFEQTEAGTQLAMSAVTCDGYLKVMPELIERFEEFARGQGCVRAIVYGRKGWQRALKQHGYTEPYITLTKEL